jgi:hypothetical protein
MQATDPPPPTADIGPRGPQPEEQHMSSHQNHHQGDTATIGRYLVSPLIRKIGDSLFAASVSIRSGHGSGTSDWVLRFTQPFACPDTAGRYATEQGLNWVRDRSLAA